MDSLGIIPPSRTGRLHRNFMGYTTTRGLEMLGFGCSSISELRSAFWQNEVNPKLNMNTIKGGGSVLARGHLLDEDDRYRKELISDIMCNLQIRPEHVAREMGVTMPAEIPAVMGRLQEFVGDGLLAPTPGGYSVTPEAQLFLRNLAMPFHRDLPQQGGTQFSRTV